jgi:hypothetical protein
VALRHTLQVARNPGNLNCPVVGLAGHLEELQVIHDHELRLCPPAHPLERIEHFAIELNLSVGSQCRLKFLTTVFSTQAQRSSYQPCFDYVGQFDSGLG